MQTCDVIEDNDIVVITRVPWDVVAGAFVPEISATWCSGPTKAGGHTMNFMNSHDDDRGWQDQANCLGVDPDLFFPERGASTLSLIHISEPTRPY